MKPDARIDRLFRRTACLSETNRRLRASLVERRRATDVAALDSATSAAMLRESRELHHHLLDVTRRVLASDDQEHRRIGSGLQDELLQVLIGIHIRLLLLRKEVTLGARDLHKHIASARRAVRESWKGLRLDEPAAAAKHAN
jgi:signal transduction histidine kinase